MILTVLFCYLGIMLAIGVWARRVNTSAEGYFLAGRKLPYWVAAFSMNATGESAWLLLGLSGVAYLMGMQAIWIVAGEALGVALSWFLVAKRLNADSRSTGTITVPDYLSEKFGDGSNTIRFISVAIILTMVSAYIAAQMLATGKAFNVFLGWNFVTGVWVGGLVTVVYTSFGGFKAVAYTDMVQALLMLFALIAVPVVGLNALGGLDELWTGLRAIDPALLLPWAPDGTTMLTLVVIASGLAVGLPFLGVPQLLVRFMAIRDTAEVPRAAGVSIIVILLFDLGAVATGLVGRVLFPVMDDAENIMPTLAQELFPPLVTGVLMVAVLSAVMSTVSSLLNLASSAIVHDFYKRISKHTTTSLQEARLGQWTTLLLGIAGCAIAMLQGGVIFSLVLFAWSGLGAAFGPAVLCALRWKKTTREGVIAGIITGFSTSILWVVFFKEAAYGLYEMVPAFIAGLVATVVVSLCTRAEAE